MPAAPNPLDPPRNYRSVCAFCGERAQLSHEHVFKIDMKLPIGEGCNTGWMRDLEGEAKPILSNLATARRRRTTLSLRAQDTLARWIAETVYMHELATAERTIPSG
jgi:hypothetical protein